MNAVKLPAVIQNFFRVREPKGSVRPFEDSDIADVDGFVQDAGGKSDEPFVGLRGSDVYL